MIAILNNVFLGSKSVTMLMNSIKPYGIKTAIIKYVSKWSEQTDADLILRWGTDIPYNGKSKKEINPIQIIQLLNNKPKCRLELEKHGINTPKTYIENPPQNIKLVIRPFYHQRGKDFTITENITELKQGYYASHLIEIKEEYRAHYLCGNLFAFYKKASIGNQIGNEKWQLLHPPKEVEILMHNACNKLNIDHTAADIYLDKSGNYGIFELNTFPTIKTHTLANLYAREIVRVYNELK